MMSLRSSAEWRYNTVTQARLKLIWANALGLKITEFTADQDLLDFADDIAILKVSAAIAKQMKKDLSPLEIRSQTSIRDQARLIDGRPLNNTRLNRTEEDSRFDPHSDPRSEPSREHPPTVFFSMPHLWDAKLPRLENYRPRNRRNHISLKGISTRWENVEEDEKIPTKKEYMISKRAQFNAGYQETKTAVNAALFKYGLGWAAVEDVLPMTWPSTFTFENRTCAQSWVCRATFITSRNCQQLSYALKSVLPLHPILRSVAMKLENGQWLHVIVRPNEQWLNQLIVCEKDVDTLDELKNLLLFDPKIVTEPYAVKGGPLFRAVVANVRSTNTAGLVIIAAHGCLDPISISLFYEDVASCLAYGRHALEPHTSYKIFASNNYFHQIGTVAETSGELEGKRLNHISDFSDAIWPPLRNPLANSFTGSWHSGWMDKIGKTRDPNDRMALDDGELRGSEGITHSVKLDSLRWLRKTCSIPVPILFKAAIALFNVSQTDALEAHFGLVDHGRSWPFAQGYSELEKKQTREPAIDINGPTWDITVDRISVESDEATGVFLHRINDKHIELAANIRAPTDLSMADGVYFTDVLRRQEVHWYPDMLKKHWGVANRRPMLTRIQNRVDRPCGFSWNGALQGPDTVVLKVTYDDGQYYADEVRGWMNQVLYAMKWLQAPENWQESVGDCDFSGGVGSDKGIRYLD